MQFVLIRVIRKIQWNQLLGMEKKQYLTIKTVFLIGASLKDLGKRWFAFSKIEFDATKMITKLEKQ